MKLFTFDRTQCRSDSTMIRLIEDHFGRIAEQTDTLPLVVATYLLPGPRSVRGAYYRRWMHPGHFVTSRGHWAISRHFAPPRHLPERFRLIRMRLDPGGGYPRTEVDVYGWEFRYTGFMDHAAMLFAHELHHYRRYHLDLHSREGEHGANRWALQHVRSLGYDVEGRRIPVQKKKPARLSALFSRPSSADPYARFRHLKTGDKVRIRTDSRKRYQGQEARVVRPLRANARRLVIETHDGKQWRWPAEWLAL